MNYLDFNAQPALGVDTNGVNMVMSLFDSNDKAWLTQSTSSVFRWACAGGHGFFTAIADQLKGEIKKYVEDEKNALFLICIAIAEFVNKDYDVSYTQYIQKEKKIKVDIPKVRKVGLFRTENYIDHEIRIEPYTEEETRVYKGWLLERLYRQEGKGSSAETIVFDYCLGADGKLYFVVTHKEDKTSEPKIFECVYYSPDLLRNPFCNIYSSAISGVIGVLDAIPISKDDPRRNVHIYLDDDYYYNFPIQVDDGNEYPFGFLRGVVTRLVNLLDEKGKIECCKKYEGLTSFMYPTEFESGEASNEKTNTDEKQIINNSNYSQEQLEYIDYDSMIIKAAKVASREPYSKSIDSFLSNPSSSFLEMFLTNRVIAADELAKSFPEFDKLAMTIIENHNNGLTGQKLFDERELTTKISNSCVKNGNGSVDTFILMTAYACVLNQGSTEEKSIRIRDMMVDHLFERPFLPTEWKEELIITALWFSNKNSFQEKVINKYQEIKDTPEYNEGIRKYNFNSFVGAGYKVIIDNRDNPDNEFLRTILIFRRKIAENVQSQYPDFKKVIQAMDVTDNALMNSGDFSGSFINESNVICDYISDGSDILDNQDYLILGAAIMSFMGRFSKPEENDGRLFIARIENIGEEIYTLPRISLFCAALWYADYNNYKQLLTEYIKDPKN